MDKTALKTILEALPGLTVCMVGDVCLDAYWRADMTKSRLSRETPHYPLPVREERYSLGGGGNVLSNLAALGVGKVLPVSVLGDDWRGFLARKCLSDLGLDDSAVLTGAAFVTPCYCKPLRCGISDLVYEDPRLDFENDAPLPEETQTRLLSALDAAAKKADIIAVCDQMEYGVVTPRVRDRLCDLAKEKPVVVDSRDRIGLYRNAIVKPNEVEAAAVVGDVLSDPGAAALRLRQRNGAPAVITLGAAGAVWCENDRPVFVPAVKTEPPVDTVGAGDTFLSAFCAAFAAGAGGETALSFANLASSVTVKKLGTTGTAAPAELLAANDRLL